jgi:hypothetical protein
LPARKLACFIDRFVWEEVAGLIRDTKCMERSLAIQPSKKSTRKVWQSSPNFTTRYQGKIEPVIASFSDA